MPSYYIQEAKSLKFFFKNQVWHLIALVVLILMALLTASTYLNGEEILGFSDTFWFWLSIFAVVTHQILVWLVFRGQLGWRVFTRLFGKFDLAVWSTIFLILLSTRPLFLLIVANSTEGTLFLPFLFRLILAVLLALPALYTLWSVIKYFGVIRALGADHFRSEYQHMPLVNEGIFKYVQNGMYLFAFFVLYAIALIFASIPALILAFFQHAYIWVHYFCTEKPDMELIYSDN